MKIFSLLLIIMVFFIGCEKMGSTTNNNYYSSDDQQNTDTEWGQDPLICGTEISDTTYLHWKFEIIIDEQQILCHDDDYDYPGCGNYFVWDCLGERGLFFHRDGSFTFKSGDVEDCPTTDGIGTWQTMNGIIELQLSDPALYTSKVNYFFNNRTYTYSTEIGSGELIFSDDQTQITLE
ncbi:MAG: hypothetical protein CMG63_03525, partial [Candidatus Marinimicrobia bacterium]|nr:hypothetical protein [Candidatus Neomarinimicrobiota bacterium]